MARRRVQLALFPLLLIAPFLPAAEAQTGNLFGTVVDQQGSPLPGTTVTLSGPGGAPQVQVTNSQGNFQFLGLNPGSYSFEAELEGYSTIEYPNIVINAGRHTNIEVTLASAIEDVITVTSESPLLDDRRISTGTTVVGTELEKIPTARDPWAVLQTTPGVLTDRINVGCGDEFPIRHLPTEEDTEYVAKDLYPTANGWGFGYVSTRNGQSRIHFGSVSEDCKLNPNTYDRNGGNLDIVDLGDDYGPFSGSGFRYAAFFARDVGGASEIRAMGFNVNANGRYTFGNEVKLGANVAGKFNLAPRADYNPVNDTIAATFTVCTAVNQGCQDQRTTLLNPANFSTLANSTYVLHLNPPDQFVGLGTWLDVGPQGDFVVTYTRQTPSTLLLGAWPYGPQGLPNAAGVTDLFPGLPGIQFGGRDSVLVGLGSYAVLAQQLFEQEFTSYVASVPLDGPPTPSAAQRVGTVSDEPTNPQLFDTWKYYGITSSAALQPITTAPAAAVAGPGLFEQQLVVDQSCHPNATTLCLGGGRFQVNVTHLSNGSLGHGTAYFLTDDTGYFTFFNDANVELLVKVIDGCGLGGNYWVFAGGLTNVEVTTTVQDTANGTVKTYKNPQGKAFQPVQDTGAFSTCP